MSDKRAPAVLRSPFVNPAHVRTRGRMDVLRAWYVRHAILAAVLLTAIFLPLAPLSGRVRAHSGGTPRLTSAAAGAYRTYAWTDPEPLRVGEVHVSLIITEEVLGDTIQPEKPVSDATITVEFVSGSTTQSVTAVQQTVLNELYYEAVTELPAAGEWQVNITVDGPAGGGQTSFSAEVLPPRTVNWFLVGAGGVLLLFLIVGMGLWSRMQPAAPQSSRSRRAPGGRKESVIRTEAN